MKPQEIALRLNSGRQMRRLDTVTPASTAFALDDNDALGPLAKLTGRWTSQQQGWNLIALPFKNPASPFSYRLLMNQYGENLDFLFVDKNIPNRGIDPDQDGNTDQLLAGLDYQQIIKQVAADDSPSSNLKSPNGNGIHHEPGLFLHILNHTEEHEGVPLSIARLATIPHGDSVLALGKARSFDGPPNIPDLNAFPLNVDQNVINNPYLAPYKHFEDNKFFGTVPTSLPGFPGFFASNANSILQFAVKGIKVKKTTELHFDTKFGTGGINNIPFVVKEANATEMIATFWIMELDPIGPGERPEFMMMYSQTVFLDFFPSKDEPGKLIRWPHVSINSLRKS